MALRDFGLGEIGFLLLAARWTFLLALVACLGGGALGLVVAGLRTSPVPALRLLARGYVRFFQGTPILIQLFMAYYGSPLLGVRPDPWPAAALTFALNGAAFFGEIFRGALEAVPGGQWECARALGLRYLPTLRLVVIPQALRLALPPTVGFVVQVIKTTSVASLIGLTELSRTAMMINTVTFQPVAVFGTISAIYFALCWPLSRLSEHLARRLGARTGPAVAL